MGEVQRNIMTVYASVLQAILSRHSLLYIMCMLRMAKLGFCLKSSRDYVMKRAS